MSESSLSGRTVKVLQALAVSGGLGLGILAVLADPLGLSGPGFGRGQILAASTGFVLVLAGLVRRPLSAYRAMAVLLLNSILLFALLELAATAYFWMASRGSGVDRGAAQGSQLWQPRCVYAPFVVWREQRCEGGNVTIGTDGRRVTPGASTSPDAFEVFCFGGSTLIGWGVPDSQTVASFLQRDLAMRLRVPVRVVNFGQQAYVNTQELIELMLQLRSGGRPDLVIFYDGFNEAFTACQSGVAGTHWNLSVNMGKLADSMESAAGQPVILLLAGRSNLVALIRRLLVLEPETEGAAEPVRYATLGVDPGSLAFDVVRVYEGNCRIVLALSDEYGFRVAFCWQPVLSVGCRIPVGPEPEVLADLNPDLAGLLSEAWRNARLLEGDLQGFHFLGGCLDSTEAAVYTFGDVCHVNAEGNRLVEQAMMSSILEDSLIADSLFAAPSE